MTAFADAFGIIAASLLFICGTLLLLGGAWLLARALAEVQRTRAHRLSADAQEEIQHASQEALDEIGERRRLRGTEDYLPPTDADFVQTLLEEREVTTGTNEEIEEASPIPADELYRHEAQA